MTPNSPVAPSGGFDTESIGSQTRRLFRHPINKKIGGVCGGLAEYFGVSTSLVRPVYIGLWLVLGPPLVLCLWWIGIIGNEMALTLILGAPFWLYLWWWLSLPVGTAADGQIAKPVTTPKTAAFVVGAGILSLLVLFVLALS